jgi:hypothetical protein
MPDPTDPAPADETTMTDERIYPCLHCPTMRTKAEGGTVFSVCDDCWDKAHPPKKTRKVKVSHARH